MSEKKADKLRFWVTYLPKNLEEGATFKPDQIHLTIVPWFVVGNDSKEVIDSFRKHFSNERAFKIRVGIISEFKNRRKILINLVDSSIELTSLHQKTLGWLAVLEARWAVKNPYVGKEYVPHIRRRPGHNLSEGETIELSSLSLVGARRRGDDIRTVLAKVDFNE